MTVVQPALAPPRIVAHDARDGSRILKSAMQLEPYFDRFGRGAVLAKSANSTPPIKEFAKTKLL